MRFGELIQIIILENSLWFHYIWLNLKFKLSALSYTKYETAFIGNRLLSYFGLLECKPNSVWHSHINEFALPLTFPLAHLPIQYCAWLILGAYITSDSMWPFEYSVSLSNNYYFCSISFPNNEFVQASDFKQALRLIELF